MIDKIKNNYQLILIILLGLIPLMWFKPDRIIASGDFFPTYLGSDISGVFSRDIFLWSNFQLGQPSTLPAHILYGATWRVLQGIGLPVGFIQTILYVFIFMGAGVSMYYLTKLIFPGRKYSPLFASIFYMFNMYVVIALFYFLGASFTYIFLPLLMAFLMKIIKDMEKERKTSKNVIYFGIVSVPALCFVAFNVPLVIIVFLALISLSLYYLITKKQNRCSLFINFLKLAGVVGLLNLWWIISLFNFYNSVTLASDITDIALRAWTHQKASFLNLFWSNPHWGWKPIYYPFFDSYSNPILTIIMFVPIILAFSSLVFKKEKSSFVVYSSSVILISLLLAKGLHEPFSSVNMFLYENIPGMYLFRNPTLKFTILALPFLALLIGFSCDKLVAIASKNNLKSKKMFFVFLFIPLFIVSSFPLLTGEVIRGQTELLPSSYVKFPNYWIDAADWLNNQSGDYRILLTPNNDFSQMPYAWGYFGVDIFPSKLISKPVLQKMPGGYVGNPEYSMLMSQTYEAIRSNNVEKFQALLDFLNVRYILHRGDIQYDFSRRDIIPDNTIKEFLGDQRNIRLAKTFGELTMYEYLNPKPLFYAIDEDRTVERNPFRPVEHGSTSFDFEDEEELEGWGVNYEDIQRLFLDNSIYLSGKSSMRVELYDSLSRWAVIISPLIHVPPEAEYKWDFHVKGKNVANVHEKIFEYDENKKIIGGPRVATLGGYGEEASFDRRNISFAFKPIHGTSYISLVIWHGKETERTLPNMIWIDDISITTYMSAYPQGLPTYETDGLVEYQKINPTKYALKVNITEPFMLVFAESYDPSWVAYTDDYSTESVKLYEVINGFWIDKTGEYTLTIEYEPQRWFYYGSIVSLLTLIGCVLYLAKEPLRKLLKIHKLIILSRFLRK